MRWVGWEGKRPTRYGIRIICARLMIGDTLFEHILRNRQTIKNYFHVMTKYHPFSRQKVIVTLFLLAVVLADLDPLDLDPPVQIH